MQLAVHIWEGKSDEVLLRFSLEGCISLISTFLFPELLHIFLNLQQQISPCPIRISTNLRRRVLPPSRLTCEGRGSRGHSHHVGHPFRTFQTCAACCASCETRLVLVFRVRRCQTRTGQRGSLLSPQGNAAKRSNEREQPKRCARRGVLRTFHDAPWEGENERKLDIFNETKKRCFPIRGVGRRGRLVASSLSSYYRLDAG